MNKPAEEKRILIGRRYSDQREPSMWVSEFNEETKLYEWVEWDKCELAHKQNHNFTPWMPILCAYKKLGYEVV